jgi:uncharacterized protein
VSAPELLGRGPQGEPRLVAGYSPSSDRYHFPSSSVCPYSGSTDVEQRLLSSTGTLWAWTAVMAPPPGYAGPTPYGFGVVEMPEGIRIVGRLTEADPTKLRIGQSMHLVVETLPIGNGDPVETYSFAP